MVDYTYENKLDYTDEQVNQLREQEKKDNKRYKIMDMCGNRLFPNKLFRSFEDGWSYIDEHVKDEEQHQDLFVVDSKEKEKGEISDNSFDVVDWDRVNNLTNKEVNQVLDLLKDIK